MCHLMPIVTVSKNLLYCKDISLRQPCRAIDINNSDDLTLAQSAITEMFKTLFSDPSGVALAAPQIGLQLRIVVISYQEREEHEEILLALIKMAPKALGAVFFVVLQGQEILRVMP